MGTMLFMKAGKLIELLNEADPKLQGYVTVTAEGLLLGSSPLEPASRVDFASETVQRLIDGASSTAKETGSEKLGPLRTTGRFWFSLMGQQQECVSLKDLLRRSLIALEAKFPGTLQALSMEKKRTKRIVARDKAALFAQGHLADKFGEELINGWYVGTNNSAKEVDAWLRLAASCAGLSSGEFRTSI